MLFRSYGGTLDKAVHDLEEGLAQIGRAFLCGRHTFADVLSGFIFSGVNTGKGGQRPAVRETCHIPDLSHELGAEGRTDKRP